MAFDAGSIVAKIQAQVENFKAGIETAKQKVDEIQKSAQAMGKKMQEAGQKAANAGKRMTTFVTAPLVAGFTLAVKGAAELEGAISKFDVVFGEFAEEMHDWVEDFRSEFPMARREIVAHSAALQDLLVPMGLGRAEAKDMTQEWMHLAGALSAFNDVPMEEALNAIRSGIAGSSEPLRRFGINASVAALEQTALAHGLIRAGEEMSDQVKQQALLIRSYEQSADAVNGLEEQKGGLLWVLQSLWATLKDVGDRFGSHLIPYVKQAAQVAERLLGWFDGLSDGAQRIIVIIGVIVAAIGPLLIIGGQLATGLGAIMGIIGGISAPVLLVVGAIGALVVALIAAYRRSEQFREVVSRAFTRLQRVAGAIFEKLAGFAKRAFEQISVFWDEHGEKIISVAVAVFERLEGALSSLLWLFNGILGGDIHGILENFWHFFYYIFGEEVANFMERNLVAILERAPVLFNTMKDNVINILGMLRDGVTFVVTFIRDFWDNHLEAIVTRVLDVFGKVYSFISGLLVDLAAFIQEKLQVVFEFWDEHGAMIMEGAKNYLNAVWDVVSWLINGIIDLFNWAWPYISSIVTGVWETIKGVISGAIDVILGIVQFFGALFTGNWSELWDAVKNIFSGVWDIIKSIFGGAIDVLKNLLKAGFDYIVSLAKRDWEKFKESFFTVFDWIVGLRARFMEWGKNLIDGLIEGITSKAKAAVDAVKEVGKKITDGVKNFFGISSPSKLFARFGENLGQGLANGIEATKRLVSSAADQMAMAATPSFAFAGAGNISAPITTSNITGQPRPIIIQRLDLHAEIKDLEEIKTFQEFGDRMYQTARAMGAVDDGE